jgi:hypothetical protein
VLRQKNVALGITTPAAKAPPLVIQEAWRAGRAGGKAGSVEGQRTGGQVTSDKTHCPMPEVRGTEQQISNWKSQIERRTAKIDARTSKISDRNSKIGKRRARVLNRQSTIAQ